MGHREPTEQCHERDCFTHGGRSWRRFEYAGRHGAPRKIKKQFTRRARRVARQQVAMGVMP